MCSPNLVDIEKFEGRVQPAGARAAANPPRRSTQVRDVPRQLGLAEQIHGVFIERGRQRKTRIQGADERGLGIANQWKSADEASLIKTGEAVKECTLRSLAVLLVAELLEYVGAIVDIAIKGGKKRTGISLATIKSRVWMEKSEGEDGYTGVYDKDIEPAASPFESIDGREATEIELRAVLAGSFLRQCMNYIHG
ncbi:hypothetical protein GLOTRDRAFT_90864 [Gloeophyllum trabeum ATCC 11539]|uniref:Uncharacterized protein n=1 Tax=Gloeophyllum trabeum (strain ATCC 11539 / FP-39264 / Madison 617) TaxID=670483 RepID=S7RWE0_GLOTA|nr:uncharacterized protein GLOTRDRAFT_90864 [Gloeophyllum trabeum ATCC 11539]EPQ59200.1 hypothetical protein GLOTRDRAFT_90864 [Gloeophyllum trabeum ATCC 11539]